MLSRGQQAELQPLVREAWKNQCRLTHRDPLDRFARESWYREQLLSVAGIRSTKAAGQKEYRALISWFTVVAEADEVHVHGFTDAQNGVFRNLAGKAWRHLCMRHGQGSLGFHDWLNLELEACGTKTRCADYLDGFDNIMEHFSIIAEDKYWQERTARAKETRIRWVMLQLMHRLEKIEGRQVDWSYVRGMYSQAHMLPTDMEDATSEALLTVYQMLDTHVRRLEARGGMRDACPAYGAQ
jgi:hypothetical protein